MVFLTSPLKPLKEIQRNLIGSKISSSSTNFVFFGPIKKSNIAAPDLWLAETYIFNFSFESKNGIQWNLIESKILTSSSKIVFFGPFWVNKNGRPGGSIKKLAHGTQVHNMFPFGPLVYLCKQYSIVKLNKFNYSSIHPS